MATETDKGLDDIRREVIESRNLVIKTDNLLKNLHAELKVVGKRQEDFARRQWVSSAVTYLGFLGLCVAGAVVVSNVRVGAVSGDREKLDKQVAELSAQVERLKSEAAAGQASEQRAAEVYRHLTTAQGDDRVKAIDALTRLDLSKVSAFAQRALQDRAALIRGDVGAGMLERGLRAFHKNDWATASDELSRYLAISSADNETSEATYALGYAFFQQKKHDKALPWLEKYVAGPKGAKNRDYAMILLVQVYDAVGQRDKGTELCRQGLAEHPTSEFAAGFRNRLRRVDAERPAAAPAGQAGPTPGPADAPTKKTLVPTPGPGPAPAPAAVPTQPKP